LLTAGALHLSPLDIFKVRLSNAAKQSVSALADYRPAWPCLACRHTRQSRFAKPGDKTMNSTSRRIAASAVSALIAMSMIQTASAGERTRKHAAVATSEQVRNANAAVAVDQDEVARYRNGAGSAPAGH
jgi:hypothetical protein